jgi:hypothetical protein
MLVMLVMEPGLNLDSHMKPEAQAIVLDQVIKDS